jgi:hyperosmotically inducible protein
MPKSSLHSTKALATAALLLAAAGAGGCGSSAYASRTAEDARLSALVEQRLAATSGLSGSKVQARSHRGVVTLVGEVPEEQLAQEAGQLAVGIPGVVRVNNLILVVKGDSQAEGSPLPADSLLIARTP